MDKKNIIVKSCKMCGAPLNKNNEIVTEDIPSDYKPEDYDADLCDFCMEADMEEELFLRDKGK